MMILGRNNSIAARVAQSVEHQAFNLRVQGSSPCSGEKCFFLKFNLSKYLQSSMIVNEKAQFFWFRGAPELIAASISRLIFSTMYLSRYIAIAS